MSIISGALILISFSVIPFCFKKPTIVWLVVFILLYKVGRSFPRSLYIKGQVTLLAGTSISARPFTFTTLSLPEKVSNPCLIKYPITNMPIARMTASSFQLFILQLFLVIQLFVL